MTPVARIEVRRGCELIRMPIAMAVGAAFKLDLEQGVLPFRDMTLRALQARVTALQRVIGRSVILYGEQGGLPTLHVVAGGALAPVLTFDELPVMSVFMAVGALLEWDGFFEIAIGVALSAIDGGVLAL